MGLLLLESATGADDRVEVETLLEHIGSAVADADAAVVESRVTADLSRLFVIVEHGAAPAAAPDAVRSALKVHEVEVDDIAEVRLVGAELGEVKAAAADGPRYLVEWDLPSDLDMDTYLARKKEKSPLYAEVPEVAFRRTYVREDMDKCLCFYDADCAADVERAREVVSTPVDRLHELG